MTTIRKKQIGKECIAFGIHSRIYIRLHRNFSYLSAYRSLKADVKSERSDIEQLRRNRMESVGVRSFRSRHNFPSDIHKRVARTRRYTSRVSKHSARYIGYAFRASKLTLTIHFAGSFIRAGIRYRMRRRSTFACLAKRIWVVFRKILPTVCTISTIWTSFRLYRDRNWRTWRWRLLRRMLSWIYIRLGDAAGEENWLLRSRHSVLISGYVRFLGVRSVLEFHIVGGWFIHFTTSELRFDILFR